jgi:response regulator of citrate/malate metabolism
MDGYLTKPIRPQELEEILKDYVSRRMVTTEAVEVAGPHK